MRECIINDAVELLAQAGSDKVWFDEVEVGEEFQSPFKDRPFVAMLLVSHPGVPPAYRDELSVALVRAGCRYAVCAGYDQEAWHTSIDLAAGRENPRQSHDVVMTTSHPDEALPEVVEFFLSTTYFEGLGRDRFLVLFVGQSPGAKEEVAKLVKAHLGPASHA